MLFLFFFFNDTATTEIYTLSLHDALPISRLEMQNDKLEENETQSFIIFYLLLCNFHLYSTHLYTLFAHTSTIPIALLSRSEEHTSELQSRQYLVCRLLLEKKKKQNITT